MPEPAIIVGPDERAAAANKPALELLPGLRVGDPFVLGLRAPDVIDARRRVMASGEAETVQWSERVPVERLFDVCVAPLATRRRRSRGDAASRLRDQTEARRVERLRVDFIANASHELRTPLASLRRLHRDPAGLGARRPEGARPVPRHHARAGAAHGAADRGPAVAFAHRAEAARAARDRRRSGADDPQRRRCADADGRGSRRRNPPQRGRSR